MIFEIVYDKQPVKFLNKVNKKVNNRNLSPCEKSGRILQYTFKSMFFYEDKHDAFNINCTDGFNGILRFAMELRA